MLGLVEIVGVSVILIVGLTVGVPSRSCSPVFGKVHLPLNAGVGVEVGVTKV